MRDYCSKPGCNFPAFRQVSDSTSYCIKHYRFYHMRCSAQKVGKKVPSFQDLDCFLLKIRAMKCPACQKQMKWTNGHGKGRGNVVSLQHWDNGEMSFICQGCNSKHANSFMRDDVFRLSKNQKGCPKCKEIKKCDEFYNSKTSSNGLDMMCRQCRNKKDRLRKRDWSKYYNPKRKKQKVEP